MTGVPAAPEAITTSWISAALAPRHGPVAAFTMTQIGADLGFASQVARLELTYPPRAAGPPSVVVKLADRTLEAEFYRDIGDYAGPRVPHAYHAVHDGDRSALVLEDIGSARFGDDEVGVSVAEAGLVVDELAILHSRWWDSPRLADFGWLPSLGSTLQRRLEEFPGRLAACLDRFGSLVPGAVAAWSARIGPQHAALFARLDDPPPTLLHVDIHVDNVAFLDGRAVLFDWQGASRGAAALDVAHFLTSALQGPDRAARPAMLTRYLVGLETGGVAGYPAERLEADVRLATLRLWVAVVGGAGSPAAATWEGRRLDLVRAALPRWAAVLEEIDGAALLA